MTARRDRTDPATWLPLARSVRRLTRIPERTRTARALAPLLDIAERELLTVSGDELGQPAAEQRDAERLAQTYRDATPEQRRSLLDRGRAYVNRLRAAVREQIRRLVAGGSTGAVLQSLRESERELTDALGALGGAVAMGAGMVLALGIGLWLLFKGD